MANASNIASNALASISGALQGANNASNASASEAEQGPSSAGSNAIGSSDYSPFQWLMAWAVLLIVLALLAQTDLGYLAIYYALALAILFLIVTQYKWFAGVLAPFGSLRPGVVAPGESSAPVLGAVPGASTLPTA